MLKVKTKDELIIALEKELSMKEYFVRNQQQNQVNQCIGRIESLKFALGFDELNKGEKHEDK